MLGRWRVVLRQAEEAARVGRYDDALTLASQPDVADHRQAVALRGRLVGELIARAQRRCEADDIDGSLKDLETAEAALAPPDALAAARRKAAEKIEPEMRDLVGAGQPLVALERIDALAARKVSGPGLRKLRDICDWWKQAIEEGRKGEFGRAMERLDQAERLAGDFATSAIGALRKDLLSKRDLLQPRVDRLYKALNDNRWTEVLVAAEATLELASEHDVARQLRQKAWQQIAAINPDATPRSSNRPMPQLVIDQPPQPEREPSIKPGYEIEWLDGDDQSIPAEHARRGRYRKIEPLVQPVAAIAPKATPAANPLPERFLLWADVVGGYLVCLKDSIILGRAASDTPADVPILSDLSRQHATVAREGDSYVIRSIQPSFVNNRRVDQAPLRDGDLIRLGASVELRFRQPNPMSATARLEFVSRHRLPMAVNGVILMADSCILGASPQSHVSAPSMSEQVVIYRQGEALWCRAPGSFQVDNRPCSGRAPLTSQSNVLGSSFAFSLEPIDPRARLC